MVDPYGPDRLLPILIGSNHHQLLCGLTWGRQQDLLKPWPWRSLRFEICVSPAPRPSSRTIPCPASHVPHLQRPVRPVCWPRKGSAKDIIFFKYIKCIHTGKKKMVQTQMDGKHKKAKDEQTSCLVLSSHHLNRQRQYSHKFTGNRSITITQFNWMVVHAIFLV